MFFVNLHLNGGMVHRVYSRGATQDSQLTLLQMSHCGWFVIPPVLNRRGEIKNKAALKTTKTSAGQPRQGRRDIKHTQIQPNRWFVSAITLTHISCSDTHLHPHIRAGGRRVAWECHAADQPHRTGRGGCVLECVFEK